MVRDKAGTELTLPALVALCMPGVAPPVGTPTVYVPRAAWEPVPKVRDRAGRRRNARYRGRRR